MDYHDDGLPLPFGVVTEEAKAAADGAEPVFAGRVGQSCAFYTYVGCMACLTCTDPREVLSRISTMIDDREVGAGVLGAANARSLDS